MGKPTGFLEYDRKDPGHRPVSERVKDYNEMDLPLSPEDIKTQAARCMDCGIPFCHGIGCPVGNDIPTFNDFVYNDRWQEACDFLHTTNNFPEITGRICPAPCETACTLGIHDDPVSIRHIEFQIVEKGFEQGWIKPIVAEKKTGKSVAVIGAGPAGMAAAQQLARRGHAVTLFDKDLGAGGLVRYGIPNFKLAKGVIDRRMAQMTAEGVVFKGGVEVGKDITVEQLKKDFDAICLTMGAGEPRDLNVPGRELKGVHFAMELLSQQNRALLGELREGEELISAKDKHVIVIGGGDTGSDCVGTSNRHGAIDIHQFEILPQPPEQRALENPWPTWPLIMRTSSSQEEGCNRRWCILTKELVGKDGQVSALKGVEVEWTKDDKGAWKMSEKAGTEFEVKADLVLLAMGFVHVAHEGLVNGLGVELDARGNIKVDNNYMSTVDGVFSAGDAMMGASLVVRAINAGRLMADGVDAWFIK